MTTPRALQAGLLLLSIAVAAPAGTQAQSNDQTDTECDAYAACALRVKYSLFSTTVVRGPESETVERIGFGAPPLEELLARSPQALLDYELFRQDHRRASWMGLLGGLGFVGGLIAEAKGESDWAAGLSIGGTVFSLGSGFYRNKANEHLSQVIWRYNESLTGREGS